LDVRSEEGKGTVVEVRVMNKADDMEKGKWKRRRKENGKWMMDDG
jgi:hypothetical protein